MSRPHFARCLALWAFAWAACGCTSVAIDGPQGWQGQRTYIGVVRVAAPGAGDLVRAGAAGTAGTGAGAGTLSGAGVLSQATPGVQQLDISTWGLRFDRGVSLGYLHDQLLSLPQTCQLVIFVRNLPELAQAARLLRSIQQESPCFVQEPS